MPSRTVSWNVRPQKRSGAIGQYRQIPTFTKPDSQPVARAGDKMHLLLKTQLQVLEKAEKGAL